MFLRAYQWLLLQLMFLLRPASCLGQSHQFAKRDLNSVMAEYDYIVVGGGTSGLVVASRLSEDPKKNILVVEYGDFADTINVTVPYLGILDQSSRLYIMDTIPQTYLNNRVAHLRAGSVVGGGSTVNGMAWDRGSAIDYNSWEDLGNPGWGWKSLIEYFRKSSKFSPPADRYLKEYGYRWSPDAYGDGPIHVGFPSWQWPAAELQARTWADELDARILTDGTNGSNVGTAWLLQSTNGQEATRSSAETAYYLPASSRPNLHLLVQHYGATIEFQGNTTKGVKITSRKTRESKLIFTPKVILAAGTINTPRILQLSGIGPKKLLQSFNIDVLIDAPGVGANFQDHPWFYLTYQFQNNTLITPDTMKTPEYYDTAWEEYIINKTGPFSHSWGNHITFESLQDIAPDFESLVASIGTQEPLASLPQIYAENPSLVRGFLRQREILQSQFYNQEAAVSEIIVSGSPRMPVSLQKPLSRGTISINSTDPEPSTSPLIDLNTNSNPIDMVLIARILRKAREVMVGNSVASLKPVEVSPGANIQSDADIDKVMREGLLLPSFDHPVGTASMMPRELGGVVDTQLRVYGIEGLWVVDASIIPLLPAAHTQATVYAVAEYAAELIQLHQ